MVELNVANMTCGHCVRAVTQAVKTVDPEAEVQVDLGSKRVRVDGQGSAEELVRALGTAGYPAAPAA
jgi:copper chaperone